MLVEAFTVFLALIGTTLSCMNTGARVTYAMGKDQEVPEHFGMLHSQEPDSASRHLDAGRHFGGGRLHRAFAWCSATPAAPADAAIKALPQGFWSSFGYSTHDKMAALPNSLLTDHAGLELRHLPAVHAELRHLHRCVSTGHPKFSVIKHLIIPVFGLAGEPGLHGVLPDRSVHGIRHEDGAVAGLGIAAVWAIYGGIYFCRSSKKTGRTTLVSRAEASGPSSIKRQ